MNIDPSWHSLVSAVLHLLSLQQRENCSDLKDSFFDTRRTTSHQGEPDSMVHLDASTKSPIQLIAGKSDTLESCKDESLLKTVSTWG